MFDFQAEQWWAQEEQKIMGAILRRVHNIADAEEVLLQVRAVFLKRIAHLPQDRWTPYTYAVAKSCAVDKYRSTQKHRDLVSLDNDLVLVIPTPSPTPSPERTAKWKILLEKIEHCLSDVEYEILIMDGEGYTSEEIAQRKGRSKTWALRQQKRIKKKVKSFSFVQEFLRRGRGPFA